MIRIAWLRLHAIFGGYLSQKAISVAKLHAHLSWCGADDCFKHIPGSWSFAGPLGPQDCMATFSFVWWWVVNTFKFMLIRCAELGGKFSRGFCRLNCIFWGTRACPVFATRCGHQSSGTFTISWAYLLLKICFLSLTAHCELGVDWSYVMWLIVRAMFAMLDETMFDGCLRQ